MVDAAPIADADLMNIPMGRLIRFSILVFSALKAMAYPYRNALRRHVAVTHTMKEYVTIFLSPVLKARAARVVDVVYFANAIHRLGLIRLLYVYISLQSELTPVITTSFN